MRIRQPMYPGKKYRIVFSIRLCLLSLALLGYISLTAQSSSFHFSYVERVQTRYASLFNTSGIDSVILGQTRIAGSFQWGKVDDSISRLTIRTHEFHSDFSAIQTDTSVLELFIVNDEKGDFQGIYVEPDFLPALSMHLNWILEWNAANNHPTKGTGHIRSDGTLKYQTTIDSTQSGWYVNRKAAKLETRSGGNLQIVFDEFNWQAALADKKSYPNSVQATESFRQFVGRKQLACVSRQLLIEESNEAVRGSQVRLPDFYFNPVKVINESERQKQIDEHLLKGLDGERLLSILSGATENDTEALFRIGAQLRAYASQRADSAFFSNLLQKLPWGTVKREIVENALMQSSARFVESMLLNRIKDCAGGYDCLRDLLIRLSLYAEPTDNLLESLHGLLSGSDENRRYLLLLTQSNLLLKVKNKKPSLYNQWLPLVLAELKWVRASTDDSLLNFQVIGNAGAERMFDLLSEVYEKEKLLRNEIAFSLRHMQGEEIDNLLLKHITDSPGSFDLSEFFADRKISADWQQKFVRQILQADARQDTSMVPMMRLLLDRRWEDGIDLSALTAHLFQSDVYKEEWESYKKGLMDCSRLNSDL